MNEDTRFREQQNIFNILLKLVVDMDKPWLSENYFRLDIRGNLQILIYFNLGAPGTG